MTPRAFAVLWAGLAIVAPGACSRSEAGAGATASKGGPGQGAGMGPSPDMRFPVEVAPVEARRVEYALTAV